MSYYLSAMEKRLSEEDARFLQSIYAPTVVAIPPADGCRNLCVTPDGEIRIYGSYGKKEPDDAGQPVKGQPPLGLCYVHLQTPAEAEDQKGTLLRRLYAQAL